MGDSAQELRGFFWGGKNSLKLDYGGGCTTLGINYNSLNCIR